MAYRHPAVSETRLTSENRGSAMFRAFPFRIIQPRLQRLDTFEPVGINCGNGFSTTAGVLKDISRNGARILLAQGTKLPNLVEIEFHLLGLVVQAHIRWHRNNEIGVRFEKPIELNQMHLRFRRNRADVVLSYFESKRAKSKKVA